MYGELSDVWRNVAGVCMCSFNITGESLLFLSCCSKCSKSIGFPITSVTFYNNKRNMPYDIML